MENFKLSSHYLISLFLLSLVTITLATHRHDGSDFATTMDTNLDGLGKEKLSCFKLYWHDIVTEPRPTAVQIIAPPANYTRLAFGLVRMIDNPLTLGPALNSTLVGQAQGFYGQAFQEYISLLMAMNFAITWGKYNGSSITVLGRNHREKTVLKLLLLLERRGALTCQAFRRKQSSGPIQHHDNPPG